MADTQYVSKTQLVALIRKVAGEQETGLLSILTDTRHAVLLKFFDGKLIHLHSRTRDVSEAIQVLNECTWVKFKFASITMESGAELMTTATLLQLIEIEDSDETVPDLAPATPDAGVVGDVSRSSGGDESLKKLLVNIATDYIGPIADMVVEEAFENNNDTGQAIEYIAETIPDSDQAAAFRTEAHQGTRLISL